MFFWAVKELLAKGPNRDLGFKVPPKLTVVAKSGPILYKNVLYIT